MKTPNEIMSESPASAEWQYGPLPPVETVPYDHYVIMWSPLYVGSVYPWGDSQNPLRWVDSSQFPTWGDKSPTGWWTVLQQGTKPRPPRVQTWPQFLARSKFTLPATAKCCECGNEWSVTPLVVGTGLIKQGTNEEYTLTVNAGDVVDWGLSGKCPQCGKIQEVTS